MQSRAQREQDAQAAVGGALSCVLGIALIIGFAAGGLLGLVGVLSAAALLRVAGGIGVLVLMPRSEPLPHPHADPGPQLAEDSKQSLE